MKVFESSSGEDLELRAGTPACRLLRAPILVVLPAPSSWRACTCESVRALDMMFGIFLYLVYIVIDTVLAKIVDLNFKLYSSSTTR